jgi:predicted AlkP superfamily phosphohydrolase/phosphomutase
MAIDLNNKKLDVEAAAKEAMTDKKLCAELIDNLLSKNETIRYNSSKILFSLTQQKPELLYYKWDDLVKHLDSDNTYHKLSAVMLLGNLTRADKDNKFEKIFNKYYSLLDDKSFITAAYIAQASGTIANAKPKLQTKITKKLLSIEETHHTQERIRSILQTGKK